MSDIAMVITAIEMIVLSMNFWLTALYEICREADLIPKGSPGQRSYAWITFEAAPG
jgi:hypothetical protein